MRTFGLRFDVNCSILLTGLPLRARAAADRGILSDPGHPQAAVAVENLRLAARSASKVGASVLVEAANVGFLADIYHLAKMGEDVADALSVYRGSIRHVQVADPPGRGAPGTGELALEPLGQRAEP